MCYAICLTLFQSGELNPMIIRVFPETSLKYVHVSCEKYSRIMVPAGIVFPPWVMQLFISSNNWIVRIVKCIYVGLYNKGLSAKLAASIPMIAHITCQGQHSSHNMGPTAHSRGFENLRGYTLKPLN